MTIRSSLFYAGYVTATVIVGGFLLLFVWLFPADHRHLFYVAWCRFVLFWLRVTCGIRYDIRGLENVPDGASVVLSNHQSEWETLFLYAVFAPVCPILKKELLDIPLWGWALRLQRPIAIDRGKPREAGKSMLLQGVVRIREGWSVVVFPEGTRSANGVGQKFSRGAATLALAASAPIVPVAHNAGHCWPAHRFLKQPGVISVVIGEPVAVSGRTASELTDQLRVWVQAQLEHTNSSAVVTS